MTNSPISQRDKASAFFEKGEEAEDALRYKDAYELYHRACPLQPDNGLYLNQAGLMAPAVGTPNTLFHFCAKFLV